MLVHRIHQCVKMSINTITHTPLHTSHSRHNYSHSIRIATYSILYRELNNFPSAAVFFITYIKRKRLNAIRKRPAKCERVGVKLQKYYLVMHRFRGKIKHFEYASSEYTHTHTQHKREHTMRAIEWCEIIWKTRRINYRGRDTREKKSALHLYLERRLTTARPIINTSIKLATVSLIFSRSSNYLPHRSS